LVPGRPAVRPFDRIACRLALVLLLVNLIAWLLSIAATS